MATEELNIIKELREENNDLRKKLLVMINDVITKNNIVLIDIKKKIKVLIRFDNISHHYYFFVFQFYHIQK